MKGVYMHLYGYPMADGYGAGWWGLVMMLFWLAVLVIVAIVVVRLIRGNSYQQGKGDPVDIAKERYAKGEITKKEFDQIKKDLK